MPENQSQAQPESKNSTNRTIQTVLAFDFGEKRIGVAVGNTQLKQAQALSSIHYKGIDEGFRLIKKILDEWQPDYLVVGKPTHPDGAPHEMTQKATRFGNQLKGRFNKEVYWVDERYSSAVAEDQDGDIDAQAAALILEQYFSENP